MGKRRLDVYATAPCVRDRLGYWMRRMLIKLTKPVHACFMVLLQRKIFWYTAQTCLMLLLKHLHQNRASIIFQIAVGYCSGYYEARSASGRVSAKKYKAQIVIFCILLTVNRFSWISWKAESHWGKLKKPLKKAESCWRKLNFVWGKSGFRRRKIPIFPRDFLVFWQFSRPVSPMQLVACVRMDLV